MNTAGALPDRDACLGFVASGARLDVGFRNKGLALTVREDAGVAQLAERLLCKQMVTPLKSKEALNERP